MPDIKTQERIAIALEKIANGLAVWDLVLDDAILPGETWYENNLDLSEYQTYLFTYSNYDQDWVQSIIIDIDHNRGPKKYYGFHGDMGIGYLEIGRKIYFDVDDYDDYKNIKLYGIR